MKQKGKPENNSGTLSVPLYMPFMSLPFTALPNVLLDEVMPTLKDTEWRVLCVITRQTLGWVATGKRRKKRDWLTQKQLMSRTGRNSAALSAAIDILVRRCLIEACDERGEILLTASQRRGHQGRIYFGLAHQTLTALAAKSKQASVSKMKKTRAESIKRPELSNPPRLYTGWIKADQVAARQFDRFSGNGSAFE